MVFIKPYVKVLCVIFTVLFINNKDITNIKLVIEFVLYIKRLDVAWRSSRATFFICLQYVSILVYSVHMTCISHVTVPGRETAPLVALI